MNYQQVVAEQFAEYVAQQESSSGGYPLPPQDEMKFHFLAEHFFDIYMSGSDFTAEVGRWAMELALYINTDGYLPRTLMARSDADAEHVLLLLNMPWFQERTDWGVSIAGSFWSSDEAGDVYPVFMEQFKLDRDTFEGLIAYLAKWSGVSL